VATRVQTHAGNIAPVAGYQELGERTLLASAKRGQIGAFEELCGPHLKTILRTTYRITKNREDAEDARQDTVLRALVHINDFDGRSRFSTWLTRIAINSALMILRKKRRSPEIPNSQFLDFDIIESHPGVSPWAPNPETQYLRRERERVLRRAVRALRPSLRVVVEFQQLQERSIGEAAKTMGITANAVKARLFHARAALRKASALKAIATTRLNYERR
jgi:RNA polymerase sigma-70 factor (ECF subfamily)